MGLTARVATALRGPWKYEREGSKGTARATFGDRLRALGNGNQYEKAYLSMLPRCYVPLSHFLSGGLILLMRPRSSRVGLYDAASPMPQEKEARYDRYSLLVDRDLCEKGAKPKKGGIKRQYDAEKMRLDLERVASERKKVSYQEYAR